MKPAEIKKKLLSFLVGRSKSEFKDINKAHILLELALKNQLRSNKLSADLWNVGVAIADIALDFVPANPLFRAGKDVVMSWAKDDCSSTQFPINHTSIPKVTMGQSVKGELRCGSAVIVHNKTKKTIAISARAMVSTQKATECVEIIFYQEKTGNTFSVIKKKFKIFQNKKARWRLCNYNKQTYLEVVGLDPKNFYGKVKVTFYEDEVIDDHLYHKKNGKKVYIFDGYMKDGKLFQKSPKKGRRGASETIDGKKHQGGLLLTGVVFQGDGWGDSIDLMPSIQTDDEAWTWYGKYITVTDTMKNVTTTKWAQGSYIE